MKILANDYLSNMPGSEHASAGGPKGFATWLRGETERRGHVWTSVVPVYTADAARIERPKEGWVSVGLSETYTHEECTRRVSHPKPTLEDVGVELVQKCAMVIREEKPDVLFLNGLSFFNWALSRAATNAGIPYVVKHAGIWTIEARSYTHLFSEAGLSTIKQMEDNVTQHATSNVFLNASSLEKYEEQVGAVPKQSISIIALPCLFTSRAKVRAHTFPPQRVGVVARWDRIKNHEAVCALAKEAKRTGSSCSFFSVTKIPATTAHAEFKEEYRKQVTVVNPMSQEELKDFYRRMDVMILPSHFDVSPFVVLEAAAEGVPTFISKGVGYSSLFETSRASGFVLDFNDPVTSLQAILTCKSAYPDQLIEKLKDIHDPHDVSAAYAVCFEKVCSVRKQINHEDCAARVKPASSEHLV